MPRVPRIFISYSHDSVAHARRVLDLADQLRNQGCVVLFDQYVPAPPDGWTRWMEHCLDPQTSDFVLMICTAGYLRRIEGTEEPGVGLGVGWEGRLIYSRLYQEKGVAGRYIPILLSGSDRNCIPRPLFDHTRFEIKAFNFQDPEYEGLYRCLTDQPLTPPEEPIPSRLVILPPRRGVGGLIAPAAALAAAGTIRSLAFRLRALENAESGFTVELTDPGHDPVEVLFACDPWGEKKTREAIDQIEKGDCLRDDLAYVGSQLWSAMVHGAVQAQFEQARKADAAPFFHIRLRLPRRLDDLPWEALYDTQEGFLGTSQRFCVIRDVPEKLRDPPPWSGGERPVGILLVMPDGSGLDLDTEKARIQQRVRVQGDAVRLEVLDGWVTPDRLREALDRSGWDVVHFAGHARTNDRGEVLIRLNGSDATEGDHWMEAEVFATLFNTCHVRLVVFNCCRGAKTYPTRGLSGLGPFLLRKGVPAVIAMRYELTDPTALRFADAFYLTLFGGPEPGRVDSAMEKARVVIQQNQTDRTVRDFITPVLYLVPGHERAFVLEPPALPIVKPVDSTPPRPAAKIPEDLLAALLERRCVPVLGPGLLSADAVRHEAPPLGPRELARCLAQESNYHPGELFELAARAGPWIDATLLQWVCQHFFSLRKIRFKVFNLIQQTFRTQMPSPLIRAIAAWNTPGYICTYFDGLLQQALQDGSRPIHVLNSLRAAVAPDPGAVLLVHLRGNWSDPDSLILTEDQHNELLDQLVELPTRVTGLVRGSVGRSLLFLGLDPREPLVRRLVAKLIPQEHRDTVGPVYFACPDPTDDDRAYWHDFETEWLGDPLADLVMALTAELHLEVSR
jgi:hypothetical protein